MHVLLVHPAFPITYWSFDYALEMVNRRASLPPLGLMTVASLLPAACELRLVDLNIEPLTDDALRWSDVVLVGGMLVQEPSMLEVIAHARRMGRRCVVGGPAPTTAPERFASADVVFGGELEGRVDELLDAIDSDEPITIGPAAARPNIQTLPVPRFDLVELDAYNSMAIQYSRGCPYHCEFCDVIEIFGRRPRVKSDEQVLAELDALYALGYSGTVFFVDDNFIGNRKAVRVLLPKITAWQEERGHPFELYTEASVNLATDEALLREMVAAGFASAFLGIESPSKEALISAGKSQNVAIDLADAIETLTRAGIEVMGGFIVGFDSDDESVFEAQRAFIQSSPVPLAMIGLLMALPGTRLWKRLEAEGRLRHGAGGDQFSRPNFQPMMDERALLRGYASLLAAIYEPDAYYDRCERYVELAATPRSGAVRVLDLWRLALGCWRVGVQSPRRGRYWRLLGKAGRRGSIHLKWAVTHGIMGEHLIRYTQEHVLPRLRESIAAVDIAPEAIRARAS